MSGPVPAIFLDRDGTLMRDVDYCSHPKDVHAFPGASDALRSLKDAGYKLIVITNQSGIARGYLTEKDYRAVERELERQLGPNLIDATYYCPHSPGGGCSCRKPEPGMIRQAATDHRLELAKSFFIGDKESDLACGRAAGTKTILVQTGYGASQDNSLADFVAKDLRAATELILNR